MSILDPSRPILVYLAAGVQGAAVVRAALRRGLKVRALVRNPARPRTPPPAGVEIAAGDLRDPDSLRAASAGVAHAILQAPIGSADEMLALAENAVSASVAAGLTSIVLKLASASRPAPCAEPSFVGNAMIEAAVRRSGLPFAVVRPTMYLDNLLKPSARAEITQDGVFAPPIAAAQPIAWTSADDCADAALTLLTRGAYGGDHRIAGPENVTGDELAARISAGLGRAVAYREQPLADFEADVDRAMGPGVGRRVASKFHFFAAQPDEAAAMLAGRFAPQPGLEDFRPTSIEAWTRRNRAAFLHPEAEASPWAAG